jgi:hypothetical protein
MLCSSYVQTMWRGLWGRAFSNSDIHCCAQRSALVVLCMYRSKRQWTLHGDVARKRIENQIYTIRLRQRDRTESLDNLIDSG